MVSRHRILHKFDCSAVPFVFDSVPQAWWTDRNGRVRYYWAGSFESNVHMCQCGLNGTCVLPSIVCNCDSVVDIPLCDQGKKMIEIRSVH